MIFYDKNLDLMKLINVVNTGDVDSMISFINYSGSMEDNEKPILRDLRLKYIDELVKMGNPAGLIWKGTELLKCNLTDEFTKAAMSCFFLAAVKGQPHGYECIGDMYFEGKGVEKNWSAAFHMFLFVIEVESNPSTLPYYKLGVITESEAETKQDFMNAFYFYCRACDVAGEWIEVDDNAIKARAARDRLEEYIDSTFY